MWIEGMDRDESERLLEQMFDVAEDPRSSTTTCGGSAIS
jgi:hypothetical protein